MNVTCSILLFYLLSYRLVDSDWTEVVYAVYQPQFEWMVSWVVGSSLVTADLSLALWIDH